MAIGTIMVSPVNKAGEVVKVLERRCSPAEIAPLVNSMARMMEPGWKIILSSPEATKRAATDAKQTQIPGTKGK